MHEVVKGLQHQVNNPLAIISLSIGRIKKIVGSNPIAKTKVENIEIATQQIIAALQKFSEAEQYESQHIDKVVGTIASLPKKH
jgi:nitrogen fixation/metabolism regulation signal transduction histidine kinase